MICVIMCSLWVLLCTRVLFGSLEWFADVLEVTEMGQKGLSIN